MSGFNGLERTVAGFLGRFPFVKRLVKKSYSRLVYLKNKKTYRSRTLVNPMSFSYREQNSFFGYYDKSPENSKGQVIACITQNATTNTPSLEGKVELAVFDKAANVLCIVPLNTYNWQQACRAHWLNDDLLVYNDFDAANRRYVSHVLDVKKKETVKTFGYPVQDSFAADYFISLNYQRLMTLRPDYGYRNLPMLSRSELAQLENDGLWKVDYATGKGKLFVSLAQACQVEPKLEFKQAVHKLNHVLISPNGKQLIFMHRYLISGRRFDRLLLADAETGALTLLSNFDMVSHCFWVDDNTVLGYMRGPGNEDAYWLIDIINGGFSRLPDQALAEYGDGHPHVHGDWFVTDTYPDKARLQHLLLCNWKTGEVKELGEFFHGFDFEGESRCDLHPRFSPDGKRVFFDSVFTGQRQLYSIAVPG